MALFLGRNSDSEKLEELRRRLFSVSAILSDVEEKQFFDEFVGKWIGDLKDFIDEDDRLTESIINTEPSSEREERASKYSRFWSLKAELKSVVGRKFGFRKALFLGVNSDSEKLLQNLDMQLISARGLVSGDAEEKQFFNEQVGEWLGDLKDVIYEADRLTDLINTDKRITESKLQRRGKFSTLRFKTLRFLRFWSRMALKVELEDVAGSVKSILDQNLRLGLRRLDRYTAGSSLASDQSVVTVTCVYGRESEREDIVKSLISPDSTAPRIAVVPIVGMGGVGKTTLARFVYEDSRLDQFDVKVWVSVSQNFDILKLTTMILEKVTAMKYDTEDLYSLQTKLIEALRGKKFVIFLDDVWNEDFNRWIDLETPLEWGSHGSKIIVTTRSHFIASMMSGVEETPELKAMADDACWMLFEDLVFPSVVDDSGSARKELREIGKEIVKKCKGLPLAVTEIARLLRSVSDPKEWRRVLESDLWDLQFRESLKKGTLPALWLSYRSLPPVLKRCFAYCSIFPKDYEFSEEDLKKLVLLWMADGFLEGKGRKTMEDVGREYLNELISRSLFQRSSREHPTTLRMHNLVHDLATRLSPEFCYLSDGCDNLHNTRNKTRHVSYKKDSEPVDTKHLRTMIALPLHSGFRLSSREQIIPAAKGCLRAFSVSSRNVILPRSIGNQKHLRYLDFSFTDIEEIPNSICTLYNLQTLLLEGCWKLKDLPTKMSRLINLRHLDVKGTSLRAMPPNMNKMTNLQTLSKFVVCKGSGCRIKELGDLNLLRGKIEIKGIGNVVDVGDAMEARLTNKKWVDELVLDMGDRDVEDLEKEREVFDALRPYPELKKLEIVGLRIENLPDWVSDRSFIDMVEVTLRDCNCTVVPPFGNLPSIKHLSLQGFDKLVSIGDEVCGDSSVKPFPRLETLKLSRMDLLEKWSFNCETTIFPRLKTISVEFCRKLRVGIPSVNLPALEYAEFRFCPAMVRLFDPVIGVPNPNWKHLEIERCDALLGVGAAREIPREIDFKTPL